MFRSCGEVESFDGVLVVAGEVVLAAVAFLVVVHVVVEVAVDDDCAELEDGLGAVGGPPNAMGFRYLGASAGFRGLVTMSSFLVRACWRPACQPFALAWPELLGDFDLQARRLFRSAMVRYFRFPWSAPRGRFSWRG